VGVPTRLFISANHLQMLSSIRMNFSKQFLKMRTPAIGVLILSTLFWATYDRYEPAGPELIQSPELSEASLIKGDASISNGDFALHVPTSNEPSYLHFSIPIATEHSLIRVRANLSGKDIEKGTCDWSCARVLFSQFDAMNQHLPAKHVVASQEGSTKWKKYEKVFKTQRETTRGEIILQHLGRSGTAWFNGVRVQPVRIKNSFLWWRMSFILLWIATAGFYFRFYQLHKRKLKTLLLLNIVAILIGTLMPSNWVDLAAFKMRPHAGTPEKHSQQVTLLPSKHTSKNVWSNPCMGMSGNARRAGHFVLFSSLCFLAYLSNKLEKKKPLNCMQLGGDILLFAATTEALQSLTMDRTANLGGLLFDGCGMGLTLLILFAFLPWIRRARQKRESQ
jgi:hypothetical protein